MIYMVEILTRGHASTYIHVVYLDPMLMVIICIVFYKSTWIDNDMKLIIAQSILLISSDYSFTVCIPGKKSDLLQA